MKLRKLNKKLILNKETIATLDLRNIQAGFVDQDGSFADPNRSCPGPRSECLSCTCTKDPGC